MTLTAAEQVALDLAEVYAHLERPHGEWLTMVPAAGDSLIAGYEVLPHVQSFADAVAKATGVRSIGTYPGHSPSIDRALDLFHAISDHSLANAISQFAIAGPAKYGVRYVIDRQQIWHRLDPVWRDMADRGDNTQNHRDHNHVSFELTAGVLPAPGPVPAPAPPAPQPEETEVSKVAYALPPIAAGQRRRVPILAIGGGFGWTKASVTYASVGVEVRAAFVGPRGDPIAGLAPEGIESARSFRGRGYVDLAPGDEWIEVELGGVAGTLDLYVEAADG